MSNPYHVDTPRTLRRYHNMVANDQRPAAPPTVHRNETTLYHKLYTLTAVPTGHERGWNFPTPLEMCGVEKSNLQDASSCLSRLDILCLEDMLVVFDDVPNILLESMGMTNHTIGRLRETRNILNRIVQEKPTNTTLMYRMHRRSVQSLLTPSMWKSEGFADNEIVSLAQGLDRIGIKRIGELTGLRHIPSDRLKDMQLSDNLLFRVMGVAASMRFYIAEREHRTELISKMMEPFYVRT